MTGHEIGANIIMPIKMRAGCAARIVAYSRSCILTESIAAHRLVEAAIRNKTALP
jgi:hypothetical protein